MRDGLVRAAATPAMGGLGVALARMLMASGLGLDLDFSGLDDLGALAPDVALFSESLGRFVVTVAAADTARFEAAMQGTHCRRVGVVDEAPRLRLRLGSARLELPTSDLEAAFKRTLGGVE